MAADKRYINPHPEVIRAKRKQAPSVLVYPVAGLGKSSVLGGGLLTQKRAINRMSIMHRGGGEEIGAKAVHEVNES